MNARWTVGDECLVTVGGNDKCAMQWRHRMAEGSTGSGHNMGAAAGAGVGGDRGGGEVEFEEERGGGGRRYDAGGAGAGRNIYSILAI
jgi:hypothetical protein